MAGIYEHEGWAARVIRAYHEPPINAFRTLALGLDGSNAVAIKVQADGTVVTSGSGSGGDGAILDGDLSSIKATVRDYANANPLTVELVDSSGDPMAVGGGTQYTEGDTDASITGTAAMWEDTSDTLRAISMAKPLPVQPGTSVTFPVTGTVTANAGLGTYQVAGIVTANAGLGTYQVAGIVTANAGLGTYQVAGIVTANAGLGTFAVAGNVTANAGLGTFGVAGNVTANAGLGTFAVAGIVTVNQGPTAWITDVAKIGGTAVVTAGVSGLLAVGGNIAHGTADAGNPVKVGSSAVDYTPDSGAEEGVTSETAADRVNLATNLKGELVEGVKAQYVSLSDLNVTLDDSPTTVTSAAVVCWQYRMATFGFTIDSTNSPTLLQVIVEVSLDGTTYFQLMNGPLASWVYNASVCATAINRSLTFPIACQKIRVTLTATGSTGSATFAVSNSFIYLRN